MREALLQIKAEQIREDLERWTQEKEILLPGEQILFELRITTIPLVRESEAGRESVFRMQLGEYFTKKYLESRGCKPGLSTRIQYAIWNQFGKTTTVEGFLRKVSDIDEVYYIKNIGKTSAQALLPILEELWELKAR